MLAPLDYSTIVNTAAIRSITCAPALVNGRERAEVTFVDGTRKVIARSVESLEWCAGPIIPAPPGFSVIIALPPDKAGGETTFDVVPVIAFRITDHEPFPLTPWGRLSERWAVVWPDGRCDCHDDQLYPSVDAYKATFGAQGERP